MLVDLREIINVPGKSAPFDFAPKLCGAVDETVIEILPGARANGVVKNSAGVLELTAVLDAELICVCARCLREFRKPLHMDISATLKDGEQDGGELEEYSLVGDCVDAGEIILTEFILRTEQRILCSQDCKGICPKCGSDLNSGPCSCKADIDPRLAALAQLLENE